MPLRSKLKKVTHAAGKLVRGRKGEPRAAAELVIITGMSGSGKASALKAFEDLGYYCVDNLPVELIPRFAELAVQSGEIPRTALVVDVREGSQLEKLPAILKSVKRTIATKVIYLEASDAALLRRFSETRRPHPLGTGTTVRASLGAERRHLRAIRKIADLVIDTSKFNVHELRAHLTDRFKQQSGSQQTILVSCVSFGYKHGVPDDADLVFDVRFLPNPHFVPEFRALTGRASSGREIHPFVSADAGVHQPHLRTAGLPAAALHSRGQKLPDHQLRMHRRTAPLGDDRRRCKQAAAESGIQSEGRASGQSEVAG